METAIPYCRDMQTGEIFSEEIGGYLQYKMICTTDPYRKDPLCHTVYSIAVIKLKEFDIAESFFMYDIARNREKALNILNCLQRNAITPRIAGDVLQDMI